jgi:hypothetical protein
MRPISVSYDRPRRLQQSALYCPRLLRKEAPVRSVGGNWGRTRGLWQCLAEFPAGGHSAVHAWHSYTRKALLSDISLIPGILTEGVSDFPQSLRTNSDIIQTNSVAFSPQAKYTD